MSGAGSRLEHTALFEALLQSLQTAEASNEACIRFVTQSMEFFDRLRRETEFDMDLIRRQLETLHISAHRLLVSANSTSSRLTMAVNTADKLERRADETASLHSLLNAKISVLQAQLDAYDTTERENNIEQVVTRDDAAALRKTYEPTGLVTLCFTDVENSTALWETNPHIVRRALLIHNDLMRDELRISKGYEVKTEGDAFMCAFQNPSQALEWCCNVQRRLLSAAWPPELLSIPYAAPVTTPDGKSLFRGMRVRMGFNVGRPLCERDPRSQRMDYFGPAVNLAARISAQAYGGEIVLGSAALAALRELGVLSEGYELQLKGAVQLKGIQGEEIIHSVAATDFAHRLEHFAGRDREKKLDEHGKMQQWLVKVAVSNDVKAIAQREVAINDAADARVAAAEKRAAEAEAAVVEAELKAQRADAAARAAQDAASHIISTDGAQSSVRALRALIGRLTNSGRHPPPPGSPKALMLEALATGLVEGLTDPLSGVLHPQPVLTLSTPVTCALRDLAGFIVAHGIDAVPEGLIGGKGGAGVMISVGAASVVGGGSVHPGVAAEAVSLPPLGFGNLEGSPRGGRRRSMSRGRRMSAARSATLSLNRPPALSADVGGTSVIGTASIVGSRGVELVDLGDGASPMAAAVEAAANGNIAVTPRARSPPAVVGGGPRRSPSRTSRNRQGVGRGVSGVRTFADVAYITTATQASIGAWPVVGSDDTDAASLRAQIADAVDASAKAYQARDDAIEARKAAEAARDASIQQRALATDLRDLALDELEAAVWQLSLGRAGTLAWRAEARGVVSGFMRAHRLARSMVALAETAVLRTNELCGGRTPAGAVRTGISECGLRMITGWLGSLGLPSQTPDGRALFVKSLQSAITTPDEEDAAVATARAATQTQSPLDFLKASKAAVTKAPAKPRPGQKAAKEKDPAAGAAVAAAAVTPCEFALEASLVALLGRALVVVRSLSEKCGQLAAELASGGGSVAAKQAAASADASAKSWEARSKFSSGKPTPSVAGSTARLRTAVPRGASTRNKDSSVSPVRRAGSEARSVHGGDRSAGGTTVADTVVSKSGTLTASNINPHQSSASLRPGVSPVPHAASSSTGARGGVGLAARDTRSLAPSSTVGGSGGDFSPPPSAIGHPGLSGFASDVGMSPPERSGGSPAPASEPPSPEVRPAPDRPPEGGGGDGEENLQLADFAPGATVDSTLPATLAVEGATEDAQSQRGTIMNSVSAEVVAGELKDSRAGSVDGARTIQEESGAGPALDTSAVDATLTRILSLSGAAGPDTVTSVAGQSQPTPRGAVVPPADTASAVPPRRSLHAGHSTETMNRDMPSASMSTAAFSVLDGAGAATPAAPMMLTTPSFAPVGPGPKDGSPPMERKMSNLAAALASFSLSNVGAASAAPTPAAQPTGGQPARPMRLFNGLRIDTDLDN